MKMRTDKLHGEKKQDKPFTIMMIRFHILSITAKYIK